MSKIDAHYYGETARTGYIIRGCEHAQGQAKRREENALAKHDLIHHGGMMGTYSMKILRSHKNPLQRQIHEACEIMGTKASILMNSKGEWNGPRIPRISLEVGAHTISDDPRTKDNGHPPTDRTNSDLLTPKDIQDEDQQVRIWEDKVRAEARTRTRTKNTSNPNKMKNKRGKDCQGQVDVGPINKYLKLDLGVESNTPHTQGHVGQGGQDLCHIDQGHTSMSHQGPQGHVGQGGQDPCHMYKGPQGHVGQGGQDPCHIDQGHTSMSHQGPQGHVGQGGQDPCHMYQGPQGHAGQGGQDPCHIDQGHKNRDTGHDRDDNDTQDIPEKFEDKTMDVNKDNKRDEDRTKTKRMKQTKIMFTSTDIRYINVPEGPQVNNKVQARPTKPSLPTEDKDKGTRPKDKKTLRTLTQSLLSTGNVDKQPGVLNVASLASNVDKLRSDHN